MTPLLDAPLLNAGARDEAEHERRNGPLPWQLAAGQVIRAVQESGLTGRGGAGFPTWRKLIRTAMTERPMVVANGAEGEPASSKDARLLADCPHLVLDGLQLAAHAVGASAVYCYVPQGTVVPQRKSDRYPVKVVYAPDTFVAGESSAVVAAIEGKKALPRDRERPDVLVQNVETLAHIAQIARYGGRWFRQHDTFLATVSGAVHRPGVYEARQGVAVQGLLDLAGGTTQPVQAVLLGGYHGTWRSPNELASTPGAGVTIALPAGASGLREAARIANYLASQSAGQCGPCKFGLPALADTLTRIASGDINPRLIDQARTLAGLVEGRGACHHPDGVARFVWSSLLAFEQEWNRG